jgi:hypothetical protein
MLNDVMFYIVAAYGSISMCSCNCRYGITIAKTPVMGGVDGVTHHNRSKINREVADGKTKVGVTGCCSLGFG